MYTCFAPKCIHALPLIEADKDKETNLQQKQQSILLATI